MIQMRREISNMARLLVAAVLYSGTLEHAWATTYYWDCTSPIEASGFGTAGGIWGTDAKWSTNSVGTASSVISSITTTADPLILGTAANGLASGTIAVSGTVIGRSITVGTASGAITLSGGTITMDQTGGGSFITVNTSSNLTINSNLDFGSGGSYRTLTGNITVNGNIAGTGARIIKGVGSFTLSSSIALAININAGTTLVGASGLTWAGIGTEGTTPGTGGTLDLNGHDLTVSVLSGGAGLTSTITDKASGSGTSTLTINYAGTSYYAQNMIIADGTTRKVAITKTGTGTHGLSMPNTYSGNTLVSQGTLTLYTNLAVQSSAIDTSGAGKLALYTGIAAPTIGGLIGSKNLASVFNTTYTNLTALTLNPGAGLTNSYSGSITNGAAGMTLTKTGAGVQILSGTNFYTGSTTVKAGVLEIATPGSLASTNWVLTGGSLKFGGHVNLAGKSLNVDAAAVPAPLLDVTGDLTLGGLLICTNPVAKATVIARCNGTLSGSFSQVNLAPGMVVHVNKADNRVEVGPPKGSMIRFF